jgi:hypothetical protein
MTTTNQINKLRSAALITANKWDGLMMPAELHEAVRVAFRLTNIADRGGEVSAKETTSALARICAAA